MRKTDTGLSLSATDLSNSVACRQLTGLDTSVALEGRKRPYRNDPLGDILAERGLAHEKAYAFHLKAQGRKVLDLSAIKDPADAAATLEAMRAGHDVIVQGALLSDDGRWYGRPDVLLRTEERGTWPWSYEAVDTKLAQETRGGTILQLSFYSDLLHIAQGTKAEHFHVVTPRSGPAGETYRTADYAAWFRSVGTRIEDTTAQTPSEVIEYLFGIATTDEAGEPAYHSWWAMTEAGEKQAFESVMDFIDDLRAKHPRMHVYHFAKYEQTAFKKLMGRHATRGDKVDELLRGGHFIDLLEVVRQALIAGVESYSIKQLEPLYGFVREVPLETARSGLRQMERALETGIEDVPAKVKDIVAGYNQDDCVSTLRLRDWLEGLRAAAIAEGADLPRPEPGNPEPSENVSEKAKRVEARRAELLAGVPAERSERNEEQQARWLLAYMLDWHAREGKASAWEYFRLRDMPEEDLIDERQALSGLEFIKDLGFVPSAKTGKPTSFVIHRYHYPDQEMEIRARTNSRPAMASRSERWSPSIASDEPSTSARARGSAREVIANLRTDLDAFSEVEVGVLMNHGYLSAAGAMAARLADLGRAGVAVRAPFPELVPPGVDEVGLRVALRESGRRKVLGRG